MFKYIELNLKTKVEPLWTIKPTLYTQIQTFMSNSDMILDPIVSISLILSLPRVGELTGRPEVKSRRDIFLYYVYNYARYILTKNA